MTLTYNSQPQRGRQGLNRKNNYESLHGNAGQATRSQNAKAVELNNKTSVPEAETAEKKEEDTFAPPKSSDDDNDDDSGIVQKSSYVPPPGPRIRAPRRKGQEADFLPKRRNVFSSTKEATEKPKQENKVVPTPADLSDHDSSIMQTRKKPRTQFKSSKTTTMKKKAINLHTSDTRSKRGTGLPTSSEQSVSEWAEPPGREALDKLDPANSFKVPTSVHVGSKEAVASDGPTFKIPGIVSSGPVFDRVPESIAEGQFREPPAQQSSTSWQSPQLKGFDSDNKTNNKVSNEFLVFSQDSKLAPLAADFLPMLQGTQQSTALDPSSDLSSLPSRPGSPDVEMLSSRSTTSNIERREPQCPMCFEPIAPRAIEDFLADVLQVNKKRLSVAQQVHFCRYHRTDDARVRWFSNGYPEIDWSTLPERLGGIKHHISAIIDDRVRSFYRQRVRELHQAQTAKGGRQGLKGEKDDAELYGYYGPRGRRAVEDFIMANFKRKLRGGTDPDLVKCGGTGKFVQTVLVPEVIQRLVGDDLKETRKELSRDDLDAEARMVMDESQELGQLLCDEEDEIIDGLSDEEFLYGE